MNLKYKVTGKVLAICLKHGIKKVAIGVEHKSVKCSVGFVFGPGNSMFSDKMERGGLHGSPAIWAVAKEAGIWGGCGNGRSNIEGGQAQADLTQVVNGCYHYNNGKWKKVD